MTVTTWRGDRRVTIRDLELTPLHTPQARDGYYFDYTLRRQFTLVATGCAPAVQQPLSVASVSEAFMLAPLDSRLFDEASTPLLNGVRFPNHVWQRVIRLGVSVTKGARASGLLSPRPCRGCLSPPMPNPVRQPHSRQVVIRHRFQGLHSGDAATRCPIIEHDGKRAPHERWHRGLSAVTVRSSHAARSPRLCHTCRLDNPRMHVQNFPHSRQ